MAKFIGFIAFLAFLYYGIKFIKNRKSNPVNRGEKSITKRYRNGLIISALILIISVGLGGNSGSEKKVSQSPDTAEKSTKVVKKTKYVGKANYKIAKKENLALIAKEKKLSEQADKLEDQQTQITDDEAAAKQREEEAQAAAQKQQEEQTKAAQQQEEQSQQQSSQQAPAQSQNRGDMNTSDSGQIVGNSNTHVYHVPGQAGYRMNSSNAVYFNSEQDAINAGYRRAKR